MRREHFSFFFLSLKLCYYIFIFSFGRHCMLFIAHITALHYIGIEWVGVVGTMVRLKIYIQLRRLEGGTRGSPGCYQRKSMGLYPFHLALECIKVLHLKVRRRLGT